MKSKVLRVFVVTILSVGILLTVLKHAANAQPQSVRWDIASLSATGDVTAGGSASATAGDGSTITLTGSGTFNTPAGRSGSSSVAGGGGTWQIFPAGTDTPSASGTYSVEGLVRFDEAPGSLAGTGLTDLIGESEDAHAGLAILSIAYSDGDRGVLVVACMLNMPGTLIEGVSATKSYVDYYNIVQTITLFHIPARSAKGS
jgi:hypothetical protein